MRGIKCKKLIAVHVPQNGISDVPKAVNFDYHISSQQSVTISINQKGIRTITVSSDKDIEVADLYAVYINLEKLLMLFDGVFIPLEELKFEDSSTNTDDELLLTARDIKDHRLPYYKPVDFCRLVSLNLIDFETILNETILKDWSKLIEDLDIIYQIMLYFTADNHVPVDCRYAFFVEAAEGMVEIVKLKKRYFDSLNPGKKGTSLKKCLKGLINQYGTEIFNKETSKNEDKFLTIMKESRVRIMHIKPNHPKKYLNGEESIVYVSKLLLLYRHILLDLLDIDYNQYKDKLIEIANYWDSYNGIVSQLVNNLI